MTYVVFDGTYLEGDNTGESRVGYELIRQIVRQVEPSHRLALATFSGRLDPQYKIDGIDVLKMNVNRRLLKYGQVLLGVFKAFNLVKRIKPTPDVIYWLNPQRFVADVPGVRQFVMVHALTPLTCPQSYSRRSRWLVGHAIKRLRRSSCDIVAISKATKGDLVEVGGISPDGISVIYHGVSDHFGVIQDRQRLERAAERLGLTGKRFLLFVGRPVPRKNVPVLMEIFLQVLRRSDEPICLVMVGPGGEVIDEICHQLGYRPQERQAVNVMGRMGDEDLVAVYNLAWALIFPTLYEGFGLPVLEAMAC